MKRRDFLRNSLETVAGLGLTGLPIKSSFGSQDIHRKLSKKPNILFIFSDQHNAGVLGCEGHPDVKTPNLDKMAAEGVRFRRAYCQDGICVPSRTSMMTGHYPRTLGVLDNPDNPPHPDKFMPLAQILGNNGYRTSAFGKRHLPNRLDIGWDYTCTTLPPRSEKSNEYYWHWVEKKGYGPAFKRDWIADMGSYDRDKNTESVPLSTQISELPPEYTMEAYTADKTIDYLRDSVSHQEPFFCWCSFYRPHQPFTPPKKYADMYHFNGLTLPDTLHEPIENLPPMLQEWRRCTSPATCLALAAEDESLYRKYIGFYYALVTEIDCHIGRIFEVLKEENLLSNTIVIYAADHGGFVGGHGMYEKCAYGHNVYEDTLRIPLIFYSKDFQKGNVCNDLVELTDIYPTLLELAEIDEPGCKMEGCSLVPTLTKGQAIKRAYAISENWFQLTVITKRYKYGQWIKVPEDVVKNKKAIKDYRSFGNMLFDLETDPLETNNLAGNPKFINVEETLKGYISEWISKVNCEGKDDFVKSLSKEV